MRMKRRFSRHAGESTFDLNLAPMMDMMVTIIPFLLLSAVFMRMMLIESPLPQSVAQLLQEDRNKKDRDVSISLTLTKTGDANLIVVDAQGKKVQSLIKNVGGHFDAKSVHSHLVQVKQQYPQIFRLELNPEDGVDYKSIVGVMDASRDMERTDPKIFITDPVKKERAEVPLLFPDVVLANLMGS